MKSAAAIPFVTVLAATAAGAIFGATVFCNRREWCRENIDSRVLFYEERAWRDRMRITDRQHYQSECRVDTSRGPREYVCNLVIGGNPTRYRCTGDGCEWELKK